MQLMATSSCGAHAVKEARISVEGLAVAIFLLFEWAMKSGARHMALLGLRSGDHLQKFTPCIRGWQNKIACFHTCYAFIARFNNTKFATLGGLPENFGQSSCPCAY
jgi:hypothetical protein